MKRYLFLIYLLCCGTLLKAQNMQTIIVHFQPYWATQHLLLDHAIFVKGMPVGQVSKFRYYISNIKLSKHNIIAWQEANSEHLIDADDTNSYAIKLSVPAQLLFDQIHFNIGIDSTTNMSGAMEGDLDPTKGMYWAWNSGYINFKLEGSSPACNTPNKKYEFHIGGYSAPFSTLQQVNLSVAQSRSIHIAVQLDQLFTGLDLSQQKNIMQPCKEAVEFSKKLAGIFHIGS